MKNHFGVVIVVFCIMFFSAFYVWNVKNENHKTTMLNAIYEAENRILKEEISDYEKKPTYEQGYKDALISVGGPQGPGSYQKGWNDAYRIFAENNGYSDGYHAAIQQFQYDSNIETVKMLVPKQNATVIKK